MKNIKTYINNSFRPVAFLLLIVSLIFIFNSCGDPVPTDYIEDTIIEGYMLVGDPIQNIRIMRTLPVSDTFKLENSLVSDANVVIKTDDGKAYKLQFRSEQGREGYFYPDSTLLVKPKTKYNLEVTLKNGTVMTGATTTPDTLSWRKPVASTIYYPKDTLKLPYVDSLNIYWSAVANTDYYLLMVKCLDTTNYGKYLTPPTNEKNRRVYNSYIDEESYYYEQAAYTFIPATSVPVVWGIFKWFGSHQIRIYVPDYNMFIWYKGFMMSRAYNPLYNSITNGKGVFGSASYISSDFFLVKNQQ